MSSSPTGKILRDYGGTVLIAVTVALLIRFFVIEAYRIPTSAMRPTLEPGDTVFVAKKPLGLQLLGEPEPQRGDVILYNPPEDSARDYIKRVIGLPGDTIEITQSRLKVNGKMLAVDIPKKSTCGTETLTGAGTQTKSYRICIEPPPMEDFGPQKVPDGSLFVLGDLRVDTQTDRTAQSKGWGLIPSSAYKGRVLWLWLAIDPGTAGVSPSWIPKFKMERMFRRVE